VYFKYLIAVRLHPPKTAFQIYSETLHMNSLKEVVCRTKTDGETSTVRTRITHCLTAIGVIVSAGMAQSRLPRLCRVDGEFRFCIGSDAERRSVFS
jgi:hypothetical protein